MYSTLSAGGFLRVIIWKLVIRKEGFWKKNLMNGTRMVLVKTVQSIWRPQGSGGS